MTANVDLGPKAFSSFDELRAVVERLQMPHLFDPHRQAIELPVSRPPFEGTLVLRLETVAPVLQIVVIMQKDLPLKRLRDLESACCRANTAIALPGFGLDYTRRQLLYRITLPTVEATTAVTLERMIASALANARDFAPAFHAIVNGQPGADVLGLAVGARAGSTPHAG